MRRFQGLVLAVVFMSWPAAYPAMAADSAPTPPTAAGSDNPPTNLPPGMPPPASPQPPVPTAPSENPAIPPLVNQTAPPPMTMPDVTSKGGAESGLSSSVPLSQQPAASKTPAALDIHALPDQKHLSDDVVKKKLAGAVDAFLKREAQDGVFVIGDDPLGKFWKLKRIKGREDNYVRLEATEDVASVAFRSTDDATLIDLDFYVTRTDDGWNVRDVRIGRVGGKPRYYLKGSPIP